MKKRHQRPIQRPIVANFVLAVYVLWVSDRTTNSKRFEISRDAPVVCARCARLRPHPVPCPGPFMRVYRDLLCLRTIFLAHKETCAKSGSSGTAASLARCARELLCLRTHFWHTSLCVCQKLVRHEPRALLNNKTQRGRIVHAKIGCKTPNLNIMIRKNC